MIHRPPIRGTLLPGLRGGCHRVQAQGGWEGGGRELCVFAEQWRAGLAWLPDYSRQVKALHSLVHSSLRKP